MRREQEERPMDGRDILDLRRENAEAKTLEDWETPETDVTEYEKQEAVDLSVEFARLYSPATVRSFRGEAQWGVAASILQSRAPEIPIWRVKRWLRKTHGARFWGDA